MHIGTYLKATIVLTTTYFILNAVSSAKSLKLVPTILVQAKHLHTQKIEIHKISTCMTNLRLFKMLNSAAAKCCSLIQGNDGNKPTKVSSINNTSQAIQ